MMRARTAIGECSRAAAKFSGAPARIASTTGSGHNDHMASKLVGSRELKVRLGTHLRRVRQGHTLVVTDRGRPIAELRPIGADGGRDAVLATLEAIGGVTRPTRASLAKFRPVVSRTGSLSQAVIDDRGDRF